MALSNTVSTAPDGPGMRCLADRRCLLEFQFPIAPLGPHVTFPMITLGHHLPPVGSLEDPLNAPEIQQLLGRYKENSVKWDKAVDDLMAQNPPPEKFTEHQESVMRRVPFEPGLRLDNRPKPRAEAAK